MALRSTTLQVPIKGLNSQANAKNSIPGDADVIENMHARLFGANSGELRKRSGTVSRTRNILGGGQVSNARKVVEYGNEQLLVTDTQLYSWSSIAGAWVAKGALTPIGLTGVPVADSLKSRFAPDGAVGGGYACFVACEEDFSNHLPLKVTVIDLSTGVRVIADASTGLTTGDTPNGRVVALADSFLIVALDAGVLSAVKIPFATPSTISGVTVIANNAATHARWDMVRSGTADQALIAYTGSAANQLRCLQWNSNMTVGSTLLIGDQGGAIGWLQHDYLNGHAYVAYIDATLAAKLLDITLAGFTGATSVIDPAVAANSQFLTGMRSGGVNTYFLEVTSVGTAYKSKIQRSTGGAFSNWQLSCGLWSRVFKQGSSYYLAACYSDGLQDKYFVLDATGATPRVVATAFDGLGGFGDGTVGGATQLASVPAISSTVVAVPVQVFTDNIEDPTNGQQEQVGVRYLKLDFSPVLSAPKQIGGALILPGGIVRQYDGQTTTELGFPVYPLITSTSQAGGGSITLLSSIEVTATYLWLDAQGQEHRSTPAPAKTVTMIGANNKLTVNVSNLRIGDKPAPVFIELWATPNAGTTPYLQVQVANDPTVDTTAIVLSTNAVTTHGEIYTDGGDFPHSAVPPASYIESWRDRAFFMGTENSADLWVANAVAEGEGISVSDQLVIKLESNGDVDVALAEMEDRMVVFAGTSIYSMPGGTGPALNGDGQYEQPARVEADVGAVDARSVTKTKEGLVFKSLKGIWLLTRALQLVRIGAEAESYDSLDITSGVVVEGLSEVRLTSPAGRTLVYHTEWKDETGIGHWATFTGQPAVHSANFGGAWCYLSSDGTVHVETDGVWADDGVNFTTTLSIGWLNLAGLFAEFRVWEIQLLLDIMGSFTLGAALSVDFDPAVVQSPTLAVTTATIPPVVIKPLRQDVRSLYLTLTETSATEGYRVAGLAVDLGVEGRIKTTATASRMT